MGRPSKLDDAAVDAWLAAHPGWRREGDAIARELGFPDFAEALGFVVRVGMLAEKRDHHPDVVLRWGKAKVSWTTHDAHGLTALNLSLAEATDQLARAPA